VIAQATIDSVFETARVEEVIGDYVQLRRSGSNYKGLSPFTDERSPSFMVSPVKQIWKDFSSGKGGNVVTFLMEHEHFTYPEAIRHLAKKYNIAIEETERTDEEKAGADLRESLYLVSEFAQKYFHDVLLNSEEGKAIGYSYFKERGFNGDTIRKFGLGFSPEAHDAFSKEALGKGYKLEFLEGSGLTIVREDGRLADRFRGRVMFPIHSLSGRVLGFGGRILSSDKKVAKYLNSPESDIYHKSKVLYGIYFAKQAIAKNDNCFLVEGYTDVIQFHQAGIENVVASSGTALTPDQIRLINRLTKNITVLFDGDAAGLRASVRGIDLILEEGMNVRVCTFPNGEDPDSFARKHSHEEIMEYLGSNSKDFIRFKASLLMEDAANDPVKKAGTIRDMVTSISKIPDRIQREIYLQECARIMEISEDVLHGTLAQIFQKDIADAGKKHRQERQEQAMEIVRSQPENAEKVDVRDTVERNIIGILLAYGTNAEDFEEEAVTLEDDGPRKTRVTRKVYEQVFLSLQEDEIEFCNPVFNALYQKIVGFYNRAEPDEAENILAALPDELLREAADIVLDDEQYRLDNWESQNIFVKEKKQTIAALVTQNVLTLRLKLISDIIQEKLKAFDGINTDEDTLEEINLYNGLRRDISLKLGNVVKYYN
jgi:DNA primase